MIDNRQETIGVRRQIDAHDLGLLVDDVINETGVLMRKSVVILAPDVRRQQIVERRDFASPRQAQGHLQPLGVLVEHGVDDMDERLVAIEEAMPSGE